jgi:CheY-like chemotaxis protein
MVHVLVVEDDEDTAASLAMLLRMYGHDVEVAADGPSALQAVHAGPPEVVLLDIAMPKMDGWQVAEKIRHQNKGRTPLLIAISGYGSAADKRRSNQAGIDLHLTKPVDFAELKDVLKDTAESLTR